MRRFTRSTALWQWRWRRPTRQNAGRTAKTCLLRAIGAKGSSSWSLKRVPRDDIFAGRGPFTSFLGCFLSFVRLSPAEAQRAGERKCRRQNLLIADCRFQIADWGTEQLRIAECGMRIAEKMNAGTQERSF